MVAKPWCVLVPELHFVEKGRTANGFTCMCNQHLHLFAYSTLDLYIVIQPAMHSLWGLTTLYPGYATVGRLL